MDNSLHSSVVEMDETIQSWEKHKIYSDKVMRAMIGDDFLLRHVNHMSNCANKLAITYDGVEAGYCRDRMCPMCQWRRSRKQYGLLMDTISCLSYQYLMLTVTRPNRPGSELRDEIRRLNQALMKMLRRPVFAPVKGIQRNVEVTYNIEAETYHPHIHALLAVNPTYFDSREYIPREVWVSEWNAANGWDKQLMGYDLQVDIRKVKDTSGIAELSKYVTKPMNIDPNTPVAVKHLRTLSGQLHGARLIGRTGDVAKAASDSREAYKAQFSGGEEGGGRQGRVVMCEWDMERKRYDILL